MYKNKVHCVDITMRTYQVGCVSDNCNVLLRWPSLSPDLTTCDFLWGCRPDQFREGILWELIPDELTELIRLRILRESWPVVEVGLHSSPFQSSPEPKYT